MLPPSRIQSFIDQLMVAHGCYRPLDLLLKTGRLPYQRYEAWRHGELRLLEDGLAGNPEQIVTLLESAAACARQLGLQASTEDHEAHRAQRMFRKSHYERLARTVYRRPDDTPQLNLFLDNRFPQARKRLCRALLDRDARGAEAQLADMARSDPNNDLQSDAEFAVDALNWLQHPVDDPGRLAGQIEHELMPRARKLLGAEAADFLAPFWYHLAASLSPERFDPQQPDLHPSWVAMQIPDWPAAVAAIRAVENHHRAPVLLARLATAALNGGDRPTGLHALFELCWQAPEVADRWLEHTTDPGLSTARDRFWDIDPPFDPADFPAWLLATGYPVPEPHTGNTDIDMSLSQRVFDALHRLRAEPGDTEIRRWLHVNHPRLLRSWLER